MAKTSTRLLQPLELLRPRLVGGDTLDGARTAFRLSPDVAVETFTVYALTIPPKLTVGQELDGYRVELIDRSGK